MSVSNATVEAWLDKMIGALGRTQQSPAAEDAAADEPAAADESELARAIREAVAAGGVNVALYMVGDPTNSPGDKEFKRQADVWAGNHGAFGLKGRALKIDCAMPLSDDPGVLVTRLLERLHAELGDGTAVPLANLALFTHGGSRSMQIDSKGEGKDEGWAKADGKVVQDLVAAVKSAVSGGTKIHLYACNTAMDKDEGKDADDATRTDSFAEDLAEATGAEVWGHENAAHTTGNSRLVRVDDSNADGNAERGQIRDVLARKFLQRYEPPFTEAQMAWLDAEVGVASAIQKSLRLSSKVTKDVDRHQVFIEEISVMGFDALFDLLIPASPPDAAAFRKLFPQHDQIDKLVDGAAGVHARFHAALEKLAATIHAARQKPDFPQVDGAP